VTSPLSVVVLHVSLFIRLCRKEVKLTKELNRKDASNLRYWIQAEKEQNLV